MNITYRNLPKIGDKGLAIPHELHTEDWAFSNQVSNYMRRNQINECWFQCFNRTAWVWFHGVVALENNKAVIKQIG